MNSRSGQWMNAVLPIATVSAGLSVLIPLYVLAFGGNVFDVGIVTALYSLVSIASLPMWGFLTDRWGSLKPMIMFSILGVFPILFILYLLQSVAAAGIAYGLYAFVATAASPSINILIMGRRRDTGLSKYISEYTILVLIGGLLGLAPGALLGAVAVQTYLILMMAINTVSFAFAYVYVGKDAKAPSTKQSKRRRSFKILSYFARHRSVHPPDSFMTSRLHSAWKHKRSRNAIIVLASMAVFNFAQFLFSTSYIPYLVGAGVTIGQVFILSMAELVGQMLVYAVVLYLMADFFAYHNYRVSAYLKVLAIGSIVVLPALLSGALLYSNLVGYVLYGVSFALWNVSASVILYDHIRSRNKEGRNIGVFMSLLSVSAFAGAICSGVVSSVYGYVPTFAISVILSLAAAAMISLERK